LPELPADHLGCPLALVCGARTKLIHEVRADCLMSLIAPGSPPSKSPRPSIT